MKKGLSYIIFLFLMLTLITSCNKKSDYEYEDYEDGVKIVSVSDSVKQTINLRLPEEIGGKKVLAIGEEAFKGVNCVRLIFSSNIKRIEKRAFRGCSQLFLVYLNDGMEYIGEEAFYRCSSLNQINIPSSLVKIDKLAFADCCILGSVEFPKENENSQLKYIGNYAFLNCPLNSKPVAIYSDLDYIGYQAFAYSKAYYIHFEKVKEVSSSAFANATNLQFAYMLFDENTIFGEGIFESCNKLTPSLFKIDLEADGSNAFYEGYPYLTDITLTSEKIASYAFKNCISLENVTITDTVKEIGFESFRGCFDLDEIIIPENVEEIGLEAFANCPNLSQITVLGNPEIADDIFGDTGDQEIKTKIYCKDNTFIKEYCITNHITYEIIE